MSANPTATHFSNNHIMGYAICNLQTNLITNQEELICISMNEYFLTFMGKSIEDLRHKKIELPNYNLIDVLKAEGTSTPPLFIRDNKKFRIDILKDKIVKNQFTIVINDVTHYLLAHQKELDASLRSARDNFRNLVHNSPMPMIVANEKGILEGNKALVDLFGYDSIEEIITIGILGISPKIQPNGKSSSEAFADTIQNALKAGSYSFEWHYMKKDGSLIISENTVNYTNVNGSSYFNCTIKDVTEIRLAQQKIAEEQERMIEALSIPITPIFKKILLLPLIGALTEKRVRLVIEAALEKISHTQSKVIILDVSGASDINIQIASHQFRRLAAATQLMGCITILSGMQPKLAEGLISLDLDLSKIRSVNNLQSALHQALIITNYEGINLAIQR